MVQLNLQKQKETKQKKTSDRRQSSCMAALLTSRSFFINIELLISRNTMLYKDDTFSCTCACSTGESGPLLLIGVDTFEERRRAPVLVGVVVIERGDITERVDDRRGRREEEVAEVVVAAGAPTLPEEGENRVMALGCLPREPISGERRRQGRRERERKKERTVAFSVACPALTLVCRQSWPHHHSTTVRRLSKGKTGSPLLKQHESGEKKAQK